jgi:hypothetical protein
VKKALQKVKNRIAAGPSKAVSEMLKAVGDQGIEWLSGWVMPSLESIKYQRIGNKVYSCTGKVKVDPLEGGSCRAIKLLEHGMKVLERVLEKSIREQVRKDDMQFGIIPGKGTTDAICLVRQLQKKF